MVVLGDTHLSRLKTRMKSAKDFIVEPHGACPVDLEKLMSPDILMQESERDVMYYRQNFSSKHENFLALNSPLGPVALSIARDNNNYHGLLRTETGSSHFSVPVSSVECSWWRKILSFGPSITSVAASFSKDIPLDNLIQCRSDITNDLIQFDEKLVRLF